MGPPKLNDPGQHSEKGVEQRQCNQSGNAAAEHVDSVVLLELHDLDVHLVALRIGGLVFLVLFLNLIHLWLNALHLQAVLHCLQTKGQHEDVDQNGEDDDRPAPRA